MAQGSYWSNLILVEFGSWWLVTQSSNVGQTQVWMNSDKFASELNIPNAFVSTLTQLFDLMQSTLGDVAEI